MGTAKTPWTDAENERLKALVAQGVSIVRVAAVFNRKMVAVRTHARRLGTPFPRMNEFRKKFGATPSSSWRLH
jgi:type IV secretory pathway protease TraF